MKSQAGTICASARGISHCLTMIHSGHASKSELSWSFADSTRLVCVRGVMLAACAVGMLTSSPLWANSRSFPLLPLGGWFPVLQSPWDVCLLSGTIFALVLALRFHQLGVGFFLVVRCLGVSGPEPASAVVLSLRRAAFADPVPRTGGARGLPCGPIRCLRLGWVAQIQCSFLSRSLSVSGFTHCGLVARLGCDSALWMCYAIPLLEIFVGVGLWLPRCRRGAIGVACTIHVVALWVLGPSGNDFNAVVWPWNLAMALLVVILFSTQIGSRRNFADLASSRPAFAVAALFSLLPALSYFGWWDSYLLPVVFRQYRSSRTHPEFRCEATTSRPVAALYPSRKPASRQFVGRSRELRLAPLG